METVELKLFCMYCGQKIPEVAKFCFNCGEAVPSNFAPAKNAVSESGMESAEQMHTGNPTTTQALMEPETQLMISGETYNVLPGMGKYVAIRSVYETMAMDASQRMSRDYTDRYMGLGDFVERSASTVEQIFGACYEKGASMLQGQGIYTVNAKDIKIRAAEYLFAWDNFYEYCRDTYADIKNDEYEAKAYRQYAKQNRMKAVATGRSFGEVADSMFAATTMNLMTGAIHGIGNSFANKRTESQSKEAENAFYKNKEFFGNLMDSIYYDALAIHRAVVDLFNENSSERLPNGFDNDQHRKANVIFENLIQGKIGPNEINRAVRDMLIFWPFDEYFYEYLLRTNLVAEDELEKIASTHGFDMAKIKNEVEEVVAREEKMGKALVAKLIEFEDSSDIDSLYGKAKEYIDGDINTFLDHVKNDIGIDWSKSNVYFSTGHIDPKAEKMINDVNKGFVSKSEDETIYIAFNNSGFMAGQEGFAVTDKAFYQRKPFGSKETVKWKDETSITLEGSKIAVDSHVLDLKDLKIVTVTEIYELIKITYAMIMNKEDE